MKASEYLERKRARKRRWWRYVKGSAPRIAAGSNGFILSGTTADIDTEDKRHAIAAEVMSMVRNLVEQT